MSVQNPYRAFCTKRMAVHQFRTLEYTKILLQGRAQRSGKELINFASNDYLGLSQHPMLLAKSQDYAARFGSGTTASRLVTGNNPAYGVIETKLAEGKGTEAALVLNSGYQANVSVLAALADSDVIEKPVTVMADRLCHNSLLQGIMLSPARLVRFQHNDLEHLENLLLQQQGKDTHVIIVTESVFGMDGDCADLETLVRLKEKYGAMLYVDEAHATGLFGDNGFGMAAGYKGAIDVVMGTFGKALGSFGAYIACSTILRDYLIQRCGGLIYSTALPPAILGSMEAALNLLPNLNAERAHVQEQAARVRKTLKQQGWNCGNSTTQIIPVILGHEEAAKDLAETLMHNGMLAPAIRPPTVPRGTSRLRLSISAAHTKQDIDHLIAVMADQMKAAA
jgi:8-amino-7-oxononanoate synthase